jgi:hypothetical protein
MTRRTIFIDCFSGPLANLQPGRRTIADGLRALALDPRVSTFDRGTAWVDRLIRALLDAGLVVEDKMEPYPWHRFTLTAAARQLLALQENVGGDSGIEAARPPRRTGARL